MAPDRETQLDELLADYLRRIDSGEFDRAAFLAEHPELAADLAELIDAAELVDQFAGPLETEVDLGATIALAGPVAAAPEQVESLGDYDLLDQLGRGGMGVVYRAWQRSMGRHVAVKMILAGRLANEADVQRFYDEARAAGSLRHRHIVAIYQVGESEGRHFYSMDLIEGATLAERINEGPLSPEQAAKYVVPIAEATHFAHGRGVLHRDLKPSNVLIDVHDQPRITDFGLAKRLEQPPEENDGESIVGTPSYMSPEQAAAREDLLGPATDVYSLGAVLYALLTGRPPFRGKNHVEVLLKVMHANATDPRKLNPRVDRELAAICMKCLHKDPERRYVDAQELADDLRRYLTGEPVAAQPMSRWERAYRWTLGIPLVAALAGRRAPAPRRGQRIAQRLMVAAPIAVAAAWLAALLIAAMAPNKAVILGGPARGEYLRFATVIQPILEAHLNRPTEVVETAGSKANLERLRKERGGFALVQEDVLPADAQEVAVATVLFYEYVHILVRADLQADSIADLVDRPIAVGAVGSGTADDVDVIFRLIGAEPEQPIHAGPEAVAQGLADAAVFTTGLGNREIRNMLTEGKVRLLPVPNVHTVRDQSLQLYRMDIPRGHYRNTPNQEPIPPTDVATVGMKTLLLVQEDAADKFVRGLLEALYEKAPQSIHDDFQLLSPDTLGDLGSLNWHDAAKTYFQSRSN